MLTMSGPDSSYSCLEIHIVSLNVDREARIDPPSHVKCFLSGEANTLAFIGCVARVVISFCIRSANPWNMELPPERTILEKSLNLMSIFIILMES